MEIALKKLGEITTGSTPSKKEESYWDAADICFVKPDVLGDEGITVINDSTEYISENARRKTRIVSKGAVFITCIGSIGKIGIADSGEYAFNQQINVIEPNEMILPRYLAYNLLYSKPKLETIANAPVVPIINKTQFGDFILTVEEDIQKQAEIVSVLDKITGIVESRKKELESFDELIKARFVEIFGDPVSNPKGWSMPLIEDVVSPEKNALKAGPFGSALKKEYYVESGYKIYGQEQVISGDPNYGDYYIDEERYKQLENCAVQAGDVLISLVGTYGKLLIMPERFEPGIINPRLMKITFDKSKVDPHYFKHFFQSDSLKRSLADNTHGGTMDILNLGIVRKLTMPLPPIELQNEFVAFVAQVDKSKVAIQKSLDETQLLFDSLMQEYFG